MSEPTTPTDGSVAALLGAFAKLPPWRGVSFRGRPEDAVFDLEGQVVVTRTLLATSRSIAVATENLTTAGLYVVIGRTGRAIERHSRLPEEQEVVLLPSSMLLVVKRARVGALPVTYVEQLDPAHEHDGPVATLEQVAALAADRVRRARHGEPVPITSPGKFVGDID